MISLGLQRKKCFSADNSLGKNFITKDGESHKQISFLVNLDYSFLRCTPHKQLHMQHAIKWHLSRNRSEAGDRMPHGVLSRLGHILTAGDTGKLVCTAMSSYQFLFSFFFFFLVFFFFSLMLFKKSQTPISNRADLSKGFDNSSLLSPF